MAAITTNQHEASSEEPAALRVETFIECVETKRKRARQVRLFAAGVGIVGVGVAILTSLGVVPADAGRLTVSAGALFAGSVRANSNVPLLGTSSSW